MAENWETIDTRADTYGGPWGTAATERVVNTIMGDPLLYNAARSLARDIAGGLKVAEPFATFRGWAMRWPPFQEWDLFSGPHAMDLLDIAKLDELINNIENISSDS